MASKSRILGDRHSASHMISERQPYIGDSFIHSKIYIAAYCHLWGWWVSGNYSEALPTPVWTKSWAFKWRWNLFSMSLM